MSLREREHWKVADGVREQLLQLRRNREAEVREKLSKLAEQMQAVQNIQRKLCVCEKHSLNRVAATITKQVERPFYEINFVIKDVEQAIANTQIKVPALKDIYQELLQADEEFDGLRYDPKEKMLSVSTESIELEGIYLGPFDIQLHISSLSEMRYPNVYSIVALDPHPAASNEEVTHPHVSNEGLCAGDAGAAIQMALANGRICDFFLLVQAVLTNYNSGSPYISLDNWYGTPCYDCGYSMDTEDAHWCEACEHDYCGDCISCCEKCEGWFCRGCLTECKICGDYYCRGCMTSCPNCGRELCTNCLEGSECTCLEEENEDEEEGRAGEPERREDGTPATQVA